MVVHVFSALYQAHTTAEPIPIITIKDHNISDEIISWQPLIINITGVSEPKEPFNEYKEHMHTILKDLQLSGWTLLDVMIYIKTS